MSLEKMLKKTKNFDHDIEYVDGRFVEEVVKEYQSTQDEVLLKKIIGNYDIFSKTWSKEFAKYFDGDVDAGKAQYEEVIWISCVKFDRDKTLKRDGKAFNAYIVSALLNQLKNLNSTRISHKNHPRKECPICGEKVYSIDAKHLSHHIDVARYSKMHPDYPLVSISGKTLCPITGDEVDEITEAYLNRVKWPDASKGYYTVADFESEFGHLVPRGPFLCPATGRTVTGVNAKYPSRISKTLDEKTFVAAFPDFRGIFKCPLSGEMVLEVTQEHLDGVLKQDPSCRRATLTSFMAKYPHATLKAKAVKVVNPYTNDKVDEISDEMLEAAQTTIKEHLEKHASYYLDKWYQNLVICPFTGRKAHKIKTEALKASGRRSFDFYFATCRFPTRQWHVKCAECGEWVPNIWDHLEQAKHSYAESMTLDRFLSIYSTQAMKATISTNAYCESSSGDSIHIADLLIDKSEKMSSVDLEDSLSLGARDDLDKRIIRSVGRAKTVEDVFYLSAEKITVPLPKSSAGDMVKIRKIVHKTLGDSDFDIVGEAESGLGVSVMVPGKDSIKARLLRLYEASDLRD